MTVPIKSLPESMAELLRRLTTGETVTFVGEDGKPQAVLVAVSQGEHKKTQGESSASREWLDRWHKLSQKIGKATADYGGSLVDDLIEMRR